jgi:hypothetical protein
LLLTTAFFCSSKSEPSNPPSKSRRFVLGHPSSAHIQNLRFLQPKELSSDT